MSHFEGHLLNPEYLKLLESMPRDEDGAVKDPRLVPKRRQATYTQKWREWAKDVPKEKWPSFLIEMAKEKAYRESKHEPKRILRAFNDAGRAGEPHDESR